VVWRAGAASDHRSRSTRPKPGSAYLLAVVVFRIRGW